MVYKKIIFLLVFLIFFSQVFSASKPFSYTENFCMETWNYPQLTTKYYSSCNINYHINDGFSNSAIDNVISFFYQQNKTLRYFQPYFVTSGDGSEAILTDDNTIIPSLAGKLFTHYRTYNSFGVKSDFINNENSCRIFQDINGDIKSNLKTFSVPAPQELLTSYYFINTSAKFFLANGSIIKIDIPVGDIPVNLSEIYGGNYLAVEFLPQDLKCDFGGGGLDSSEIQGVFVNNSLANINDYFNNTVGFLVNDSRQINILNDTLKVDINYSNGGKNVSVNFSRLKKSGGKNVSVYFLLNKSSWGNLSVENISDLRAYFEAKFSSSKFEFFIVDKDPIIGYHFDILPDNINVGFNGTIDGVLIESDAVVYSGSRDFVFNYRGSGGNCDEKLVNSGGKNICINFFVDGINGSNKNYINNGSSNLLVENINLSINLLSGYVANFTMSLYNPESGAYSCLGIIESGELKPCDEGNPQKRIWVGIFKSVSSNLVEVEVIELSNTAIIQFNNTAGDGELNISYCVYEGNVVCSFDEKNKTGANITLSCGDGVDGCIKRILYAVNNSGDLSENETFILPILKLGSVCDNRCVATPFPNILLSSCQGINGCNFFNYGETDDGAEKCNYQSPNARVFSI